MAIPDELNSVILRLNQELSEIEQLATEGLNITQKHRELLLA